MHIFIKNTSMKILIASALIVYFCCQPANARPSETLDYSTSSDLDTSIDPSLYNGDLSPHVIRQIQKCDKDLDRMELCMRCAKVTKSQIVYPMCCGNEEGVTDWCREYIYYGATPN